MNKRKIFLVLLSFVSLLGLRAQQHAVTNFHNQQDIVSFETDKGVNTDFVFTLAPDETASRPQWPIVFIDWRGNGDRQMVNLTKETSFTVKVPTNKKIVITGENGLWTVKSVDQSVKKATTNKASILKHLYLDKNLLGKTAGPTGGSDFAANANLETLSLSENYYKTLEVKNPKLKTLNASTNMLRVMDLSKLIQLSSLNLSKNLLKELKTLPKNTYSLLDLRVNRMNISTLPTLPGRTPKDKYLYTLQERYVIKRTDFKPSASEPRLPGTDMFPTQGDEIDLSSQWKATGVAGSVKETEFLWYEELNSTIDSYRKLTPGVDYVVKNGKTRFLRNPVRHGAAFFVVMASDAFPGLESFERTVNADTHTFTKDGAENIWPQPDNNNSADFYTKVNDMVENRTVKAYRSNIVCWASNYWMGSKSNVWSDRANWTAAHIPNTRKTTPTDEVEAVEFAATKNENWQKGAAMRDLHVDDERVVYSIVNKSETGKGIVIPAGTSLRVKQNIETDKATTSAYGNAEPAYRVRVESSPQKPNGTLIFDHPNLNKDVYATVEFYSKGYDGNFDKQHAGWQYFGVPVVGTQVQHTFPSAATVRAYKQAKKDDYDEKWEAVQAATVLAPFAGYEITQPVPATYLFKGKLQLQDSGDLTVMAPVANALYGTFNAFANSYTGSYAISKIQFGAGLDKTVYIYNTGSRIQWLDHKSSTGTDQTAGQYIALPQNAAGTATLIPEIPSMQGFMVRLMPNHTAAASFKMPYSGVVKEKAKAILRSDIDEEDSEDDDYLLVDVFSDRGSDRLYLLRRDGTTKSFDNGWDGAKIFSQGRPQLFAIGEREEAFQVSTASEIDNTPVGFRADESGSYTLTFTVSPSLLRMYPALYIKDRHTGALVEIRDGATFTFTATRSADPHRFDIVAADKGLGSEVAPSISIVGLANRMIKVDNTTAAPTEVCVYDMAGRLVVNTAIAKQTAKEISVGSAGTYVVKAFNEHITTVEKVTLQ